MIRNKKIVIVPSVLLMIYSLIGFFVVPLVLESKLPEKLSEVLDRSVSVKSIRLNPFRLTASVKGLNIRGKNMAAPLFALDEFFINLESLSLLKMGLVVREVKFVKPEINLARISETEFNFTDLLPEKNTGGGKNVPATVEKPFQFSVSNIAIIDGDISIEDKLIQKEHVFSKVNLVLPKISNFDSQIETYSLPKLSGHLNQAGFFIDVDTKPFDDTMETIVHLSLKSVEMPYYFTYIPEGRVGFDLVKGHLDLDAYVTYINKGGKPEVEAKGSIDLSDVEIFDKNRSKIFSFENFHIDMAPSYPLKNQVELRTVKIASPELIVVRNKEGIINLTTLVPQDTQTEDNISQDLEDSPSASIEETDSKNPFRLDISEFVIDSSRIVFKDFAANTKLEFPDDKTGDISPAEISIDDLGIKMSHFSTAPKKIADFNISGLMNKEAGIATNGQLGITPLKVEADYTLQNLKLSWIQPYIPDSVRLIISSGVFNMSGHSSIQTDNGGNLKGMVTGKAAIDKMKILDPFQKELFFSWQTFSLEGFHVDLNPFAINVDRIFLKDFSNHMIVFNDGEFNIEKIFVTPDSVVDIEGKHSVEKPLDKGGKTSVTPIHIGEVLLKNFDSRFMDRSIEPDFSTRLNLTELKVTGLTSEDFKAAEMIGKGKIDEYAPLNIKGSINPLGKDLFLDITCNLKNMELSPFSSYTGKYIGRMIEKGKMNIGIEYEIDHKTINARNRILLDQFTLGQKVESEEAVNLPVGLAISLLKDRNGQINIDLPVSGRTDDPEFKYGKTLFKTFRNMIIKAATSPFDLVSSVIGGGEEFRYIEFDPASNQLNDAAKVKLDAIKKLMHERPGFKIDISGYIDMESDKTAFVNLLLSRKIKKQKLKNDMPQDMSIVDDMVLDADTYAKCLKEIYADTIPNGQKVKKNFIPLKDPNLTIGYMESYIKKEIPVTDENMRFLAMERAKHVKKYLLEEGIVSADRIFLKEPDSLTPPDKEKYRTGRVELNVR